MCVDAGCVNTRPHIPSHTLGSRRARRPLSSPPIAFLSASSFFMTSSRVTRDVTTPREPLTSCRDAFGPPSRSTFFSSSTCAPTCAGLRCVGLVCWCVER